MKLLFRLMWFFVAMLMLALGTLSFSSAYQAALALIYL